MERARTSRWAGRTVAVTVMVGMLAAVAMPGPASAASTYDWTLSCKGSDSGNGVASWVWTADGSELGRGGGWCSGNYKEASSDVARPDGATELTVTVSAYFTDGAVIVGDQKTVSKSFRVDGRVTLKASVSFSEDGVLGYGDLGRYSVAFSVSG